MTEQNQDEKSLFEKLSEILNSPLPGTDAPPVPAGATVEAEAEDDDSIFGRIRDILEQPLPGTQEASTQSPAEQTTKTENKADDKPVAKSPTDIAASNEMPMWFVHEKYQFEQHLLTQRMQLVTRQQQELAAFQRYQQNQLANFDTHQANEKAGFERHQQARLNVALHGGVQMPPGWPLGMPPPPGWRPGMPLPPVPPAGWLPPGINQ